LSAASGRSGRDRQEGESWHALATERWWFWAGSAFVFVALGTGYLLIPFGRISEATCDKIHAGMTYDELSELLGERHESLGEGVVMDLWEDEDGNYIGLTFEVDRGVITNIMEKQFHAAHHSFLKLAKRRVERRIKAFAQFRRAPVFAAASGRIPST
jgi:hypothetical protein